MPLHDWSQLPEWEGVQHLWISELYYDIRDKLPPGYRAGLGTVPALTIGASSTRPDVGVLRTADKQVTPLAAASNANQFEFEAELDVLSLDASSIVQVFRKHDLVAVLELISPRNKDRESTRITTRDRIIGYLMLGVHVVYVDVHSRPSDFSLADFVAKSLELTQPALCGPHSMAYRVGSPSDKQGRSLAMRQNPFTIGQPLPALGLPLNREISVSVDLETTYTKVTQSYLSWLPFANGSE